MNATDTLYTIEADGEWLLFLSDAHLADIDLPLGCTRDAAQAVRWADEARAAGRQDVRVIEVTY